jgi:hypothetical protein
MPRLGLCMVLIFLASAAAAAPLPRKAPNSKGLLVTGTLENQWDGLVKKSLFVEIYAQNHCIGKVTSHDGMFHLELSDRIAADMPLTILVRSQVMDRGHLFQARRFSFAKCLIPAANAQNIVLKIAEHDVMMRKSFQFLFPRHRHHRGRTLYINNI